LNKRAELTSNAVNSHTDAEWMFGQLLMTATVNTRCTPTTHLITDDVIHCSDNY